MTAFNSFHLSGLFRGKPTARYPGSATWTGTNRAEEFTIGNPGSLPAVPGRPLASGILIVAKSPDLGKLLETLPDAVLLTQGGVVVWANAAALKLFRVPEIKALRNFPVEPLLPDAVAGPFAALCQGVEHDAPAGVPLEITLPGTQEEPDGIPMEVTAAPFPLPKGTGVVSLWRNVRHRQEELQRKQRLAQLDSLTGLPNRALFMDRLEQEVSRATRNNRHLALMFIDLDRFKWVNDTLGHAAGDELLKETAARLRQCLRRSDTVARLGGDEFTAILPDMSHGPLAERVATKVLDQLSSPYGLEGQEVFISGSIGITVFPDDASTPQEMMKNADAAMYRAKHEGRNAYRFFTPDMHTEAMERMKLEQDLRHALDRQQLEVHYQPIVEMVSGQLLGAESFLRWKHPQRGYVPPNLFVRLAEEVGLISGITEWALHTACSQAARWRQQAGWERLYVTVNLSCVRCRELSTDDKIPGILERAGLPPEGLILELTESILGEDETRALAMLHHLKKMGIHLWLDDFGTGQSSLSILRKLPLDAIKIDQTFVQEVPTVRESAVLVRGLMSLAKRLNLKVVGEGVEGTEQMVFLRENGCLVGQGYLFGRPLPAAEFAAFFTNAFPV